MNGQLIASALAAALLASGCVTVAPGRYMVSQDVKQSLKSYEGSRVRMASVGSATTIDTACRGMGPLPFVDGRTVPQFVEKAFNDEFKYAGIHAENGVALKASLTRAEFSSTTSLVDGWWALAMTLESSNGKSMNVDTRYDFEAGFAALTACSNSAQALGTAVQGLIRKTVADPRFATLIH